MNNYDEDVYNYALMETATTALSQSGETFQKPSISVLESCLSVELNERWHLDLCSPFWRLYVNQRSGAWLIHNHEKLVLKKGELWLIPAWVRFQTGVTGTVRQDYLHFDVRGLPRSSVRRIFTRPICLPLSTCLLPLYQQWRSDAGLAYLCWATALAHAAFAAAMTDRDMADLENALLFRSEKLIEVIEVIERDMNPPPSNQQLAALFGCSRDHFIRLFRNVPRQPD